MKENKLGSKTIWYSASHAEADNVRLVALIPEGKLTQVPFTEGPAHITIPAETVYLVRVVSRSQGVVVDLLRPRDYPRLARRIESWNETEKSVNDNSPWKSWLVQTLWGNSS